MDTRNVTEDLAFGHPAELPLNTLPTELEVARCFLFEKRQWMMHNNQPNKEPDIGVIAELVVEKVENTYFRASIPTIRKDKIKAKLLVVYAKRSSLQRIPGSRRYKNPAHPNPKELTDFFRRKQADLVKDVSSLFEVANNDKVPELEKEFLEDQRSGRLMTIDGKIDRDTTRKQLERLEYERAKAARVSKEQKRVSDALVARKSNRSSRHYEDEEVMDLHPLKDPKIELQLPITKQAQTFVTIPVIKRGRNLTEIAEAKARNEISDRATAAIVNATLRTFNIPEVVDKSKIRRAVDRKFEESQSAPLAFGGGLGFDGRKDLTLCQEIEDGKYYQSKKMEEHYSLVSLPDGKFIGHVSPADGKARTIATCLSQFLEENNLKDSLEALVCDGTNTNVGAEGGVNHYLETDIGRPLQWFVCLLHANELPLRHLIVELDGPASGANTFSGPIGKMLPTVTDFPIVSYKRFSRSPPLPAMPKLVWNDLSMDQKYLWKIVSSIITGKLDKDLQRLTIGPCCHSRWLTTACRICRLYVCTAQPSDTLVTLVTFIVNVYAPMWFLVKHHENAVSGPENLFFLIKNSEGIEDPKAKEIAQQCIQRNAFFAHPENILLSQLASKLKSDRFDAVRTIIDARAANTDITVRLFRVPPVDFQAKKWQLMIKWKDTDVYEPPLVNKLTNEQLLDIVTTPLVVPAYKCHSQIVERAVKEVTRASLKVISGKRRDATIMTTMESRSKFPKQESKKDFIPKKCT